MPEWDMLYLCVMGKGAGGLGKFFRRRSRRHRRRRRPPQSMVFWFFGEIVLLRFVTRSRAMIFWRRHMKATVEAILLFLN